MQAMGLAASGGSACGSPGPQRQSGSPAPNGGCRMSEGTSSRVSCINQIYFQMRDGQVSWERCWFCDFRSA